MRLLLQKHYIQTIILLSFFALFICLRVPDVFLYGRFWAEEGFIFFYNAWTMSPLQALFNSYGGYLNLPTNAITLIARWFIPLEYAPYFTILMGILFQLLPLFLLLTSKEEWLSSFQVRLLLTLLLLFVPESIETSLHSLHIQFQLTLTCGVILILNPNYSYQRWLKILVLLLAGFSGLMNFALLPLYAIRFWIDKTKLKFEEFTTLSISCLIQYFVFYEKTSIREHLFTIHDFFNIFFVRELYTPLFGNNSFTSLYMHYVSNHMQSRYVFIISFVAIILFLAGTFRIFYKYPKTRPASFLLSAAILIFIISIIGSIGNTQDFLLPFKNLRYLFISQSLLCIMLVYIIYHLPPQCKKIGILLLCWLIFINSCSFFAHPYIFNLPKNCMPWRQQVKIWKQNPTYNFQLWPYWMTMTLPPLHAKSMEKK